MKFSRGAGAALCGLLSLRNFCTAQLHKTTFLDLAVLHADPQMVDKLTNNNHTVPFGLAALFVDRQRKFVSVAAFATMQHCL